MAIGLIGGGVLAALDALIHLQIRSSSTTVDGALLIVLAVAIICYAYGDRRPRPFTPLETRNRRLTLIIAVSTIVIGGAAISRAKQFSISPSADTFAAALALAVSCLASGSVEAPVGRKRVIIGTVAALATFVARFVHIGLPVSLQFVASVTAIAWGLSLITDAPRVGPSDHFTAEKDD